MVAKAVELAVLVLVATAVAVPMAETPSPKHHPSGKVVPTAEVAAQEDRITAVLEYRVVVLAISLVEVGVADLGGLAQMAPQLLVRLEIQHQQIREVAVEAQQEITPQVEPAAPATP